MVKLARMDRTKNGVTIFNSKLEGGGGGGIDVANYIQPFYYPNGSVLDNIIELTSAFG